MNIWRFLYQPGDELLYLPSKAAENPASRVPGYFPVGFLKFTLVLKSCLVIFDSINTL